MYDVIIVGARCAGSPLGMLLARSGRRVLVVDRATFPSDTVSTHFIQQTGIALLRDWGVLEAATGNAHPIRHMTASFKDLLISGFADPIDGIDRVYAPRRTVMDAALLEAAVDAGAEVRQGYTVEELIVADDRVVGIRGRAAGGRLHEERAAVVVGADGANSTVARLTGAAVYNHVPAACFIYYSYFAGLDWNDFHHRTGDFQQMGAWPTNDGLHLVAVMRKRDRFAAFRAAPAETFAEIVDTVTPDLGADLRARGERVAPLQPMLYPDNYYRQAAGPGWALVGDAGYHKDPYTGNGIADAFRHAGHLAETLHANLDRGPAAVDAALKEYGEYRDEESAQTYEFTCTISELELPQRIYDAFDASSRSQKYRLEFFRMMAGAMPGHEFFAPDRLERMYREVGFVPAGAVSPNGGH
ncbi:NAD(P)/FAD-dependent oxidoreductase [Nocardia arizonensis]|uniref:NAD(P)/FAD-dependent oxidoreductase n=1 Tax=Nocardia arizonensis TaxID=1141647 RepID=UPI0006CF9032|nr:NAD(P)/FAD-dependent oxidoreductase [Nocardia arizonensis]